MNGAQRKIVRASNVPAPGVHELRGRLVSSSGKLHGGLVLSVLDRRTGAVVVSASPPVRLSELLATGLGGSLGNKGGCAIALNLAKTSMLFVNAHFAAHQKHVEQRNADFARIDAMLAAGFDEEAVHKAVRLTDLSEYKRRQGYGSRYAGAMVGISNWAPPEFNPDGTIMTDVSAGGAGSSRSIGDSDRRRDDEASHGSLVPL